MSKPKSYVRPKDGATMVAVEPHQYVNAKIPELQGRHPGGQKHDELAAATVMQSARRRAGEVVERANQSDQRTATRPENA
jgi:hypothetical protein